MPILDPHSLEIISRSVEQTRRVGMRLGGMLETGDILCLVGDLGSGKTTFVQGLAAGWGSLDQVSSPSFVLVNIYRYPSEGQLFHLDAYRLDGVLDAQVLDIGSMLEKGPLVVEWADHIEDALPKENLWVNLRWVNPNQRDLTFNARGYHYETMLAEFRKRVYGGM
ncbi:MAG: tRNA (adenosine(37)-N6)-threonylcarbamoyltransferase complex ATPase subunit type 1 TsaE [Anaerolineales bacterium]|nr:tRNA (adenosine(37)-N6)-threonylcarbamoyltransferase complex ATPase subunit type 1 TsaE [Anaerolineales bacterium]